MERYHKRARQDPLKYAELKARNQEANRKYRQRKKKGKMRFQSMEEQELCVSWNPMICDKIM